MLLIIMSDFLYENIFKKTYLYENDYTESRMKMMTVKQCQKYHLIYKISGSRRRKLRSENFKRFRADNVILLLSFIKMWADFVKDISCFYT